jgi:hypothetical protein
MNAPIKILLAVFGILCLKLLLFGQYPTPIAFHIVLLGLISAVVIFSDLRDLVSAIFSPTIELLPHARTDLDILKLKHYQRLNKFNNRNTIIGIAASVVTGLVLTSGNSSILAFVLQAVSNALTIFCYLSLYGLITIGLAEIEWKLFLSKIKISDK